MEDWGQYSKWPLRVPGHAFWAYKRSSCVSIHDKQCTKRLSWPFCLCLLWWYSYLFPWPKQTETMWPELPAPDSCKKVMQFLGFANFYRRFIRGFSALAAPLHVLTSSQVQLNWTPEAETAFETHERHFTLAPFLTMPDPQRQFMVKVDASNKGVGAAPIHLPVTTAFQSSEELWCCHPGATGGWGCSREVATLAGGG